MQGQAALLCPQQDWDGVYLQLRSLCLGCPSGTTY